ncbi:MAG: ROK family protein [Syntrophaceae bacterium]|nr:ROK family protein [Syntrophaceae bacterium]
MVKFLIGADVGATNVRIGVVTPEGEILERIEYPIDSSGKASALLEQLVSNLNDLSEQRIKRANHLIGIGVGIAGTIDLERGIVYESPNIKDLKGFRIRDFFREKISRPVVIENDANAFTLGEGWMGAAKGCQHYCGLTLGTGVGGGIVVEGRLLRGAEGLAGEVGHMVIYSEGPACGCGGRGCLEVYASGTAIRRMALEAIERGVGGGILKWVGRDLARVTSEKVFEVAQYGDIEAQEIFNEMGRYLGLGLVNLINLFNPERIVIGGKVSQAWDYFIGSVTETIRERAMEGPKERVEIVRARCGDDAGILGAAYSALSALLVT